MKYILIVMLFLLLTVSTGIAETLIKFGAIEKVPPYSYMENHKFRGIDYEIYLELKDRIGFKANFQLFPARRVYFYAETGEIDVMLQLYYKPVRENGFIFSKQPIRWSEHYIFVRSDNLSQYITSDINALYGKTVGKNLWYFINREFNQAYAEKKFRLKEAVTTEANLKKLMHGRIDCYISAYNVAVDTIKQLNLSEKIVHLSKPLIPRKGVFIGLSKNSKNVTDKNAFMQKIDTALKEMHADGTIKRIENAYFR